MGIKSMPEAYGDMLTNLAKSTVAVPLHLQGAQSARAWWESPDSLLAKTSIAGAADPTPAEAVIVSEPLEDPTLAKSYAYTKDGESKLDISDARHVAMACEALSSGGFRGNQVEIPEGDRAKVKAKVRAAWKKFNPGKDESEMPASIRKSMTEDLDEAVEDLTKALGYRCQDCGGVKSFEDMKHVGGALPAVSPDYLCKNCAAKYDSSSTAGKAVTKVKRATKAAVSAFVEPFTYSPAMHDHNRNFGHLDKSAMSDELQKSLADLEALADALSGSHDKE
jgi:hypothetical protein